MFELEALNKLYSDLLTSTVEGYNVSNVMIIDLSTVISRRMFTHSGVPLEAMNIVEARVTRHIIWSILYSINDELEINERDIVMSTKDNILNVLDDLHIAYGGTLPDHHVLTRIQYVHKVIVDMLKMYGLEGSMFINDYGNITMHCVENIHIDNDYNKALVVLKIFKRR